MNKRGAGVVFCLIAALLFSARYITAAIFMNNVSELFASGLRYQGNALLVLSVISLLAGVAYLVWAEIEEWKRR